MLIVSEKNKDFPTQLQRLNSVPKQLYIESTAWPELLDAPMLAVVGSRKPTPYGANMCAQIVREAASKGVCIVSGLALGIDSIAHRAALEVGGKTIAVIPAGLDNIYPASHRQLAKDIVHNKGALLSEHPPRMAIAYKSSFVQRSRIVAGLSKVVFIPEAAAKSGSLHTAQFALESGVDVCVLPGQVTNPMAEGCNNLLKSGAALISSSADILAILNIAAVDHKPSFTAANPEEQVILELMATGLHDADELLALANIPVSIFNQTLTMLEITGKITPKGGNTWYLT